MHIRTIIFCGFAAVSVTTFSVRADAASCPSYPYTLTNGTTADADQVMANFNTIMNCLSLFVGGTSTGTATAQVVATVAPSTFALTTGNRVTFMAGYSTTGATTLNVASTGAVSILKKTAAGLVPLGTDNMVAGQAYTVQYDGTQFQLLDPTGSSGGTSATDADRANIMLSTLRIQMVGGLSVQNMINGVVDEFEDESGVDAPVSNKRSHTSASAYLRYSYSTYEALYAFDGNTGTHWFSNQSINSNSSGIDFLGVQLDAAYNITKARIYNVSQAPATVKIQYSDDGSSWSDALATWSLSGSIGAFIETTWASVGSHAYWRLMSSSATTADGLGNPATGWKCAELEFYELGGGGSLNADYDATGDFYSPSTGTNMTLISTTTTAEAQPDEALLVVWEEDVDSITLNTDLMAYVSRDGGSTWTAGTLTAGSSLTTGRALVASVDLSVQPSGTGMAWKFVTANEKALKIHGVGLDWR